jgi:hypothetical protein
MKIAVFIAVVIGIVLVMSRLLSRDMCTNDVLAEYPSPDGRSRLVVFQRSCATTDFSTQASLLRTGESLTNHGGNVLIADTDHGRAPSGPGGGPAVEVLWKDAQSIVITHHPLVRVFKSESSQDGVHFGYRKESSQ